MSRITCSSLLVRPFSSLTAAMFGLSVLTVPVQAAQENWRQSLFTQNLPSIVTVLPQRGKQQRNIAEPEGTGVFIDGFILTANHVLDDANRILIRDHSGNVSEAKIFLRDRSTDLALLETDVEFTPAEFAEEASQAKPGSEICAIGNAFGLGLTMTCGIISATGQRGIGFNHVEDFLQIDAAINPGMSGAPLFDTNGRLAGLVTAIFTKQSDGNLGVNFASSVRLLRAFIDDARDGKLETPRAGMVLVKAPQPGETGKAGGLVQAVASNSAEEKAGLKAGDLVLATNGIIIRGQADYVAALVLSGINSTLSVELIRQGKPMAIQYQID